jgi:2-amino-4-hydroxy-6-hydroxymethyldihydropteridine diphosphokinase
MARVVLALGSNLGDRGVRLEAAVSALSALPQTTLLQRAKVYETEPVDVPLGYEHLTFLNSAVLIETALEPMALLREIHRIEAEEGRVRHLRNGPRTLDIDIILYEGVTSNTPALILPHPRAAERDFVLLPLADLGLTRENLLKNTF